MYGLLLYLPVCLKETLVNVCDIDTEGFRNKKLEVVDVIVPMTKSMSLEVESEDVEELVEDYSEELATEELVEL